jgi:hypothetical protein
MKVANRNASGTAIMPATASVMVERPRTPQ